MWTQDSCQTELDLDLICLAVMSSGKLSHFTSLSITFPHMQNDDDNNTIQFTDFCVDTMRK